MPVQRNLVIMTAFVPHDFAIKKNLPLLRIPTCTSMINDKKLFFFFSLVNSKTPLLWIFIRIAPPWRGDSNKYPRHMFLGVLNTVILNISNYLPHLVLRNCSIQIVVIVNFVIISNVGIKRFDCTMIFPHRNQP